MDIELFSIGFDVEVVSSMGGVMYTRTPQNIRNWCNKKITLRILPGSAQYKRRIDTIC